VSTPIYAVRIQNADSTGTAYYYTTASPKGGGSYATAATLLVPESIERTSDPLESRIDAGTCSFSLRDLASAVTPYVDNFINKAVWLYTLDVDEDWASAVTLFVGVVQEYRFTEIGYQITARSAITLADTTLFNAGRTKIATAINSTDTAVVVDDASNFADTGVVLIESERIAYGTRTDSGTTWTLGGLTRGYLSSTAASHALNVQVAEDFILGPGHPFQIMSDLLSDVADGKTGLGMSLWVNTTNIAAQITAVGSTLQMFFEMTKSQNAKRFIEDELLKPMGAYPFENSDGLIGVKIFSTAGATVDTIEDADSIDRAQWSGNFPRRVNQVVYRYDWNPVTDDFDATYTESDQGMIDQWGALPIIVESRGIDSSLATFDDIMEGRGRAWIDRFGAQLPTVNVRTLFASRFLDLADDVATTFERIISLSGGTVGLTNAPAEIVRMKHNLQECNMEFDLMYYGPVLVAIEDDDLGIGLLKETVAVA
jgi:hypothetical protein